MDGVNVTRYMELYGKYNIRKESQPKELPTVRTVNANFATISAASSFDR